MDEIKNPCTEIKLGKHTVPVAEESIVTLIGNISPQDVEDGTVLVFRINTDKVPAQVVQRIAEQVQKAVVDTFEGKIKAIIVPHFIEVQTLKDILKDATNE